MVEQTLGREGGFLRDEIDDLLEIADRSLRPKDLEPAAAHRLRRRERTRARATPWESTLPSWRSASPCAASWRSRVASRRASELSTSRTTALALPPPLMTPLGGD